MADVSVCFVFSHLHSHRIVAAAAFDGGIVTGGAGGELYFWKGPDFSISSVGTVAEDCRCLDLSILLPPSELVSVFSTTHLIISLHSKGKLRLWTFNDGKCVSNSGDLFGDTSLLEKMIKISDYEIAVIGKHEIFLIDAYRMQNLKYFSTEGWILSGCGVGNEIYVQTSERLYMFNLKSELESSKEWVLKNRIDESFPVKISGSSIFLAIYNRDLQILLKGKDIQVRKMPQDCEFSLIAWESDYLICVGAEIVKLYKVKDVLRAFCEEKFRINAENIKINVKACSAIWNSGQDLYFGLAEGFLQFNYIEKEFKCWKGSKEDSLFPELNVGEEITTRNILLSDGVYLSIGTNIGRVIVYSLLTDLFYVFFHNSSPITFTALHKSTLAVSNEAESLIFWSFSPNTQSSFNNFPDKTIDIMSNKLKLIVHLDFIHDKNCQNKWEDILIGQTDTGSMLLIDFSAASIISYFQALSSWILTAKLHVNLDYLQIYCSSGRIYIFNMTSLTLEREISGDAIYNFHVLEKNSKNDRFSVLLYSCLPHYSHKTIKETHTLLEGNFLPVLYLNSVRIYKKQLPIIKNLKKLWQNRYLKEAFCAKTREISFNLTQNSRFYNSVKLVNLFQVFDEIESLEVDFLQILSFSLSPDCKFRRAILDFCQSNTQLTEEIHKTWKLMQKSTGKNFPQITSNNSNLALSEVIVLCYNLINALLFPSKAKSHFFEDIQALILCNSYEFSLFACQLLISGSCYLENYISEANIRSLVQSLLQSSCHYKKSSDNEYFYAAIICVGQLSISFFIKTLTKEIQSSEKGKLHHKIFFTIEHLILNNFLQATSVIEELADFLLKSHELKETIGSKRFSTDFSTVLETLVGLLPMTAHSADIRFLICGLPTGRLLIYDFKAHKKWKPFKLFSTTITAIDVREFSIACYSSQESLLKTVKMEPNLILSGGDLKITETVRLPEIEIETNSYLEMIKTTKVKWTSKNSVLLFRENKQEYEIQVNN